MRITKVNLPVSKITICSLGVGSLVLFYLAFKYFKQTKPEQGTSIVTTNTNIHYHWLIWRTLLGLKMSIEEELASPDISENDKAYLISEINSIDQELIKVERSKFFPLIRGYHRTQEKEVQFDIVSDDDAKIPPSATRLRR